MNALQILQRTLDLCTDLTAAEKDRAQEYLDVQRQWAVSRRRSRAQVRILVTNPEKEWVYAYDLGPGSKYNDDQEAYQVQHGIHEIKQAVTQMLCEALNLSRDTSFEKA